MTSSEVPRRLPPSTDTIRQLYLHSGNQCAYPGCSHPIILPDGTYVGELCHISAAEKGGERFDASLTNEQRRQPENLLLLCHDHHTVTNNVDEYPTERLRTIKEQHESKFKNGLASMEKSSGLNIVDSTVSLGGSGGAAPGAGGGGGGALGPYARGGDGGAGGGHRVQAIDLTDVAELRVQVGEPGSAGTAGTPAGRGGDTIVEAVGTDGRVREVLRAPGGPSADSQRGEVRVADVLLSDSAQVYGGLLSVLGAGWSKYFVNEPGATLAFGVSCLVEQGNDPEGRLFVSVRDPLKNERFGVQADFDFSRGSVPFAASVRVENASLGEWCVTISSGKGELCKRVFTVVTRDTAARTSTGPSHSQNT
jgi:hypothetical protein